MVIITMYISLSTPLILFATTATTTTGAAAAAKADMAFTGATMS
jgi:hypothetical protein